MKTHVTPSLEPTGDPTDLSKYAITPDPTLITLYLLNDVHLVKGATLVRYYPSEGLLHFVDRESKYVMTKLPFTLTFDPVEMPDEPLSTETNHA